jgi:hypothetical protein
LFRILVQKIQQGRGGGGATAGSACSVGVEEAHVNDIMRVALYSAAMLLYPASFAALLVLLSSALSYHCSLARPSAADCKEEWFEQRVDHFSSKLPPSGSLTWRQRFLTNDLHYDPVNGCIFFYTGNEGDVSLYANNTGLMYAREYFLISFAAVITFVCQVGERAAVRSDADLCRTSVLWCELAACQ